MELSNSKRLLFKASYVSTQLTPGEQRQVESKGGGGIQKAFVMRALGLDLRGVEAVRARLRHQDGESNSAELARLLPVVEKIARNPTVTSLELAADLAPIPYEVMTRFINELASVHVLPDTLPLLSDLLSQRRRISPIGRLHLERIEMYSVGVERGELVFTVPMAGGETVSISHKEWSTSSRSLEDVSQDFFESYSERGVTEKSDVSMSSERESNDSSNLNFSASTSGKYFGVSVTTTLGLTTTSQERASAKHSAQQSREITEKASAKVRQEHKVSVKIETKSGTEERIAKTITNPSHNAVRLDYYRMMRKWRTDLYRYGLRLTYDIAIPLPGVRLWAAHKRLAAMDQQLRAPYIFSLNASDLNDDNWEQKAKELGVPPEVVPPPPAKTQTLVLSDALPEATLDKFGKLEFVIPPGYRLASAQALAIYAANPNLIAHFTWHNGISHHDAQHCTVTCALEHFINTPNPPSGTLAASYSYNGIHSAGVTLTLTFARRPESELAWQREAWAAIRASDEARAAQERAILQQQRDSLWRALNGKDTLRLRRLEREELIRVVMQWLLGPNFPIVTSPASGQLGMPAGQTILDQLLHNEELFQNFATSPTSPTYSPTLANISEASWYGVIVFGDFVKFVHQAIEWENLLYFLYPYFWGSEVIGRDKMLFEHADAEHERFLRAGYARIVLPVRPGFEADFTGLMERGSLVEHSTHPFVSVAEDIANFAKTNYSGIPPANPEVHARPLLFPEQRATWDIMQALMAKLEAYKIAHGSYPADLASLPGTTPAELADYWGHPLVYKRPGLGADYDLISLGEDGKAGGADLNADISSAADASLIATWCDYTPTSALDIEMNTNAANIA